MHSLRQESYKSPRPVIVVALTLAVLAACGTSGSDEIATPTAAELAPIFSPVTESARAPDAAGPPRTTPPTRPSTPDRTAPPAARQTRTSAAPASPAASAPSAARLTDTTGDVDWTLRRPPGYVDIAAAKLTRTAQGFTLRVRFTADLPHRQRDEHTMNVASFFDTTGDGEIDYEIWANLADDGWGPSYRDRRNREARFMADSDVHVEADGDSLVFRFPLAHLNRATTLQWATASEWGTYETLSTPAAATDHAPNTGAAPFPR